MKRVTYILLSLAFLLIGIRILAWTTPNVKYGLWSVFQKDVSLFYRGDIGHIYKIGTKYDPSDSIVEYYWNENYMWKGHIELNNRSVNSVKDAILKAPVIDSEKLNIVTVGIDSLFYYSYKPDKMQYQAVQLYNFNTRDEIHFYGKHLPFDNTIKVGIILLYGKPQYFRRVEIPNSIN